MNALSIHQALDRSIARGSDAAGFCVNDLSTAFDVARIIRQRGIPALIYAGARQGDIAIDAVLMLRKADA
jgi:hypothetical protein